MKSISTPRGFEPAERAVEIGCIKSSIQIKKVMVWMFVGLRTGFLGCNVCLSRQTCCYVATHLWRYDTIKNALNSTIVHKDSFYLWPLKSCMLCIKLSEVGIQTSLVWRDYLWVPQQRLIFVLHRTHTIYVVFQSRRFYCVPRVLIADARSFQAFAAILDWPTHLALNSCWYRSDARQYGFRLPQAALLWISKVRGYDHVCRRWSAKKKKNTQNPVIKQENTSNALF